MNNIYLISIFKVRSTLLPVFDNWLLIKGKNMKIWKFRDPTLELSWGVQTCSRFWVESFKRESGFREPYQPFTDLRAFSLSNGSLDPKRGFKSQSFKCDRTKSVLRLIQTSQFTSSSSVILVYIFLWDRPPSSVIGINAWMAGLPPACPFLMVSKHVTKFYKGHRGKRRQVFHPPPKRKC